MREPVVDPEGNTYEKRAIEEWLQRNATSPLTRNRLTAAMLKPNRALGAAIEEYSQFAAVPAAPPAAPADAAATATAAPVLPEDLGADRLRPEVGVALQHFCLDQERGRGVEVGVEVVIEPPAGTTPTPLDVTVVLDISGSMATAATVQQDGREVDVGFSVLDVTKHAIKTVIASLRPTDRLSIVTFSSKARCDLDWTQMTPENQERAKALVDALQTEGATNLWDGLRVALGQFRASPRSGCLSSLLLLTDGEPSSHLMPPRGIVPTLERELDKMTEAETCVPVINTFGFGYRLDTQVLVDIASKGRGAFSFIPDSGFVGTVFIHSLANTATTLGKFARLGLQASSGAKVRVVHGDSNDVVSSSDEELSLTLDSLHYGQARRVLVAVTLPDGMQPEDAGEYLTVQLLYTNTMGKVVSETRFASAQLLGPVTAAAATDARVREAMLRLEFVALLASLLPNAPAALFTLAEKQAGVNAFVDKHRALHAAHGILTDTESQVALAVASEDAWRRWGYNYVCSLLCAHRQQCCNNFKDMSVATYGGALFSQERDRADDIFSCLPPPLPSSSVNERGHSSGSGNAGGNAGGSNVRFEQLFNNASNGCLHPSCLVRMADGTQKRISDLVKGDKLARPAAAPAGDAPTVVCVVQTDTKEGVEEMVSLNGGALILTPWHPIWDPAGTRASWAFPHDLAPTQKLPCTSVWNLVLDSCHMVDVGGIACVTLGHGLEDDEVVQHSYFGTERVLRDLQALAGEGFARGHLRFACGSIARNPDGSVLGYQASRLLAAHSG